MDLDFAEKLGIPPFDSAEGGRWMQQQAVFKALETSPESPQVVAALKSLAAAFESVVALHEGEPEGTTTRKNVLAYLEVLTTDVYAGVEGLPRISSPHPCGCGHSRAHHYQQAPAWCRDCQKDSAQHLYTPTPQ